MPVVLTVVMDHAVAVTLVKTLSVDVPCMEAASRISSPIRSTFSRTPQPQGTTIPNRGEAMVPVTSTCFSAGAVGLRNAKGTVRFVP